jgi:cell division protein FtsB
MSNFKISPFIQGKPAVPRRWWLSRFLLLIIAIEIMAFGYWIFRLNAQITELKQQINAMRATENEEEHANIQQ